MKCKGCNIEQDKNPYKNRLFFTNDGYCSVCNAKYKGRPRTKSIFEFTIIKEGSNAHIDSKYRKATNNSIMSEHFQKRNGPSLGNYLMREYKKSRNRKITDYQ